jgi:hypothetical protein
MTSMYNKLCNKQDGSFSLIIHIFIKGKDHKMSLKTHTNHFISLNHAYLMVSFSFSILFYNVNNSFMGFHKLQGYFKFIK